MILSKCLLQGDQWFWWNFCYWTPKYAIFLESSWVGTYIWSDHHQYNQEPQEHTASRSGVFVSDNPFMLYIEENIMQVVLYPLINILESEEAHYGSASEDDPTLPSCRGFKSIVFFLFSTTHRRMDGRTNFSFLRPRLFEIYFHLKILSPCLISVFRADLSTDLSRKFQIVFLPWLGPAKWG